jgi:uncharacterized protein (DUF433 family)
VVKTFENFDRITSDPAILGGKPCVRGMRLSVQRVLEVLSDNPSWDDLKEDYPELESEDIRQAMAFAAELLADRVIPVDIPAA